MKSIAQHPSVRATVVAAGLLAGATVIVLFSWNSFAPDLFGLEALRFKQALGLTLFTAVVGRLLVPHRSRYSGYSRLPRHHEQ